MPLYEYQCLNCGEVTEVLQRMSDDPLTVCKRCEGELKRLVSAPAVQFKGTGWYVTDYAKKGAGGKGDSPGGSESSSSESSGGAKSESKDSGAGSKSSSSDKAGTKSSSGDKKSA